MQCRLCELFQQNRKLGAFAEAALGVALGRVLTLSCGKCTKLGVFTARTRDEVVMKARIAGWRMVEHAEICPSCLPPTFTNDLIYRFATDVINAVNA